MVPHVFEYVRIGSELISRLSEKLARGESIALLGARFCGKRYLAGRLREAVEAATGRRTIEIKLLTLLEHDRVTTSADLKRVFSERLSAAPGTPHWDPAADSDLPLQEVVRNHLKRTSESLLIIVSNVDALPDHLAREVVAAIQGLVNEEGTEDRRVVAVLTGEGDLSAVAGDSRLPYAWGSNMVVQGFDRDEFGRFMNDYLETLGLKVQGSDCEQVLFDLTRGNGYLLWGLLWVVLEDRIGRNVPREDPILVSSIPRDPDEAGFAWARGGDVFFKHTVDVVAGSPECTQALRGLLSEGSIPVREDRPTRLEMAGLAIREGGKIEFASDLVARFAKRYYDARRLADLLARHGDWDQAFALYERLTPDERIRPSSAGMADLQAVANAFKSLLHAQAVASPVTVAELFVRGVKNLLGFTEVTFWGYSFGTWQVGSQGWGDRPPKAVVGRLRALLPPMPSSSERSYAPRSGTASQAVVVNLPETDDKTPRVAVLSSLHGPGPISAERRQMANQLGEEFCQVLRQAQQIRRTERRLELRERHIRIILDIVRSLGSEVLDVGAALRLAGQGLRGLGYKRVVFSLVDPERKRIIGVHEDSPTGQVAAEMTDWELTRDKEDVQPFVVATKVPVIIEDARTHPLTNKAVVTAVGLRGMAVLPILSEDTVLGTIHVERDDGVVPSQEEVEDLVVFARQLAVAIQQSERVAFLQTALHRVPNSVLVFDHREQVRYVNESAGRILSAEPGWRSSGQAEVRLETLGAEVQDLWREAIRSGKRLARHVKGVVGDGESRAAALAAPIKDWQGRVIGGMVHLEVLDFLQGLLHAIPVAGAARDVQELGGALLEATRSLHLRWGRLYLVDPKDPEVLAGRVSYGYSSEEEKRAFEGYTIKRGEPNWESWKCIDERQVVAFSYDPSLPDQHQYVTNFGLQVINMESSRCPKPVIKARGDFWIDLPLLSSRQPGAADPAPQTLGKVSLYCPPDLDPLEFELLRLFAEIASALIDGLLQRQQRAQERETWLQTATDKAIADTSHHVKNRVAALPVLLARYRGREDELPALKAVNDDFRALLEDIEREITRIKERLGPIELRPERRDVSQWLREIMKTSPVGPGAYHVTTPPDAVDADLDPSALEHVFVELAENSRIMRTEPGVRLSIAVTPFSRAQEAWVRLEYKDNGPGVPPEFKKRIFENFFSRRPHGPGSGIGLPYVRRVIEAHGGTIEEIGTEGAGAHFRIEMPRYQAPPQAETGGL